MFYKHWKKILLSVLALFWSGCENEDNAVAGYGCDSFLCYNATATTKSGKVFDIIECDYGYKFLRHPNLYYEDIEVQDEIDNDLHFEKFAPYSDERCGALNCKYIGPDICYDESFTDTNGVVHTYNTCVPTIDCPEKP